jgi:hypothetical protein
MSLSFTQFRFSFLWKEALTLCLAVNALALSVPASASELDIKTFNAPGAGNNGATSQGTVGVGVNVWGAIVGITRDSNDVRHGFMRAPDGRFVIFDHPEAGTGPGQGTRVNALNALGAVSGSVRDANGYDHPYIRDPNGYFITINFPGLLGGNGGGINLVGAAVGNYLNLTDDNSLFRHYHAYLRSPNGAITKFDPVGSANTDIPNGAINDWGAITGDYWVCAPDFSSCTVHGFVRAPSGVITSFDVPGAGADGYNLQGTFPQGINDLGEIVGYYEDANNVNHGFVRSATGVITTFDAPGACGAAAPPAGCAYNGTFAYGINSLGAVVGQYWDENTVPHGFLRAANGSINKFDVPRAGYLTLPVSINAWGLITGYAYDANFVVHGLLVKP